MQETTHTETATEQQTVQVQPQEAMPQRKSRFVDDTEFIQIDLDSGDWVRIPKTITYAQMRELQVTSIDEKEKVTNFLIKVIKEWNLLDTSGVVAPINGDYISRLSADDMLKIMGPIDQMVEKLNLPKVVSPRSVAQ